MFAHILRAKDLPQEANLMDRVLQGGSAEPDPFAIVEVLSSHGEDIAITKAAVRGSCVIPEICHYQRLGRTTYSAPKTPNTYIHAPQPPR